MLESEGATALRCPMVSILDASDEAPVIAWLRELVAGRFDFGNCGFHIDLAFFNAHRHEPEVLHTYFVHEPGY